MPSHNYDLERRAMASLYVAVSCKKNPNISIFGTCKYYQNAQL